MKVNKKTYSAKTMAKKEAVVRKQNEKRELMKRLYQEKEWYTVRNILGNNDCIFYILIGGRERGKSYSVMKYCLTQWKLYDKPFTWMRLNEVSLKKMLQNDGIGFIDADLVRHFNLDLKKKGNIIYDHGKPMITALCLSTAYNDKGVALFDNEYDLGYNIVLDEFQLEKGQKRTFDITYNLVVQLENLVRSRKEKVRIFMIGNTTEEISDILSMFNFIPQDFGVYKLKNKRCIIDYMPNSEAYIKRRKGSVGDILAGNTSNYTNKIENDTSLITKKRLYHPQYVIKFSKDKADWFTCWEGNIITEYKGENKRGIAMRRYLDEHYDAQFVNNVFEIFDARAFRFRALIVQKKFAYQLSLLKKQ